MGQSESKFCDYLIKTYKIEEVFNDYVFTNTYNEKCRSSESDKHYFLRWFREDEAMEKIRKSTEEFVKQNNIHNYPLNPNKHYGISKEIRCLISEEACFFLNCKDDFFNQFSEWYKKAKSRIEAKKRRLLGESEDESRNNILKYKIN